MSLATIGSHVRYWPILDEEIPHADSHGGGGLYAVVVYTVNGLVCDLHVPELPQHRKPGSWPCEARSILPSTDGGPQRGCWWWPGLQGRIDDIVSVRDGLVLKSENSSLSVHEQNVLRDCDIALGLVRCKPETRDEARARVRGFAQK